jgi:hypothetical protein
MESDMEKLPVIFRKDRNKRGEVTAVFPTLPADYLGHMLTCYAHIGQHASCSWEWFRDRTHRPATPDEYADLLAELHSIYGRKLSEGDDAYDLVPCRRISSKHRAAFNAEVRRLNSRA